MHSRLRVPAPTAGKAWAPQVPGEGGAPGPRLCASACSRSQLPSEPRRSTRLFLKPGNKWEGPRLPVLTWPRPRPARGPHLYRFTKCFPADRAPECRSKMDACKRRVRSWAEGCEVATAASRAQDRDRRGRLGPADRGQRACSSSRRGPGCAAGPSRLPEGRAAPSPSVNRVAPAPAPVAPTFPSTPGGPLPPGTEVLSAPFPELCQRTLHTLRFASCCPFSRALGPPQCGGHDLSFTCRPHVCVDRPSRPLTQVPRSGAAGP